VSRDRLEWFLRWAVFMRSLCPYLEMRGKELSSVSRKARPCHKFRLTKQLDHMGVQGMLHRIYPTQNLALSLDFILVQNS